MPVKKSLFSKPAWAARVAPTSNNDQPIFGQDLYEDILEAKRKVEEKKLAKQRDREDRKAHESKRQSVNTQSEDGQVVKKRRISGEPVHLDADEDDDDKNGSSSSEDTAGSLDADGEDRGSSRKKRDNGETSGSRCLRGTPTKNQQHVGRSSSGSSGRASIPTAVVIDDDEEEDDDEDEVVFTGSQVLPSKSPPPQTRKVTSKLRPVVDSDPESEEEDDYIRELKRKARAEAREKQAYTAGSKSHRQQDDSEGNTGLNESSASTRRTGTSQDADSGTPQPESDPRDPLDTRVQILVSTIIPNCTSLVIERFASQSLDKVFAYWKKRNELNRPELMKEVFFTWNGQKLYSSTTTRSILEQIKRKHGTKSDGSDLAEGKIEIEAMIQKIYDYRIDQKKRFQAEAQGTSFNNATEGANENGEDEVVSKQQKTGIVIHLNSNDKDVLPFLNLRVRPDTTVQRIISGYKRKVGLDASRQVYLVFDGERLEPEANVEQIGLEDEDAIDVME